MSRKTIFILGSLLLGLALVLLALMLIVPSMMTPAKTSPGMIDQIPPDGSVSVVAQVMEIDGDLLKIEVLEGNGYDVFDQRTGVYLQAEQAPGLKFVMGGPGDIQTGAIAQFDGTKIGRDRIRLTRIVILSGYVEGPGQP